MRGSFRSADYGALTELWNRFYPEEFAIDAEILERHTLASGLLDWGASFWMGDSPSTPTAFVAVKTSASPRLFHGADREVAHLAAVAFDEVSDAIEILGLAKQVLHDRGIERLVMGRDYKHLLPGCPVNAKGLCNLLMVEGFDGSDEVVDLEIDLGSYEAPNDLPFGCDCRPLTQNKLEEFDALMEKEFGAGWRRIAFDVIEREGPESIYGLFASGDLAGFAVRQKDGTIDPVGGGVWRKSLGEGWCALGPLGVANEHRGKGYGAALVGACLTDFKHSGHKRCIVDWTDLTGFYERFGFQATRRYRLLDLVLEGPAKAGRGR